MASVVLALRHAQKPNSIFVAKSASAWLYATTIVFASGGLIFYLLLPYIDRTHGIEIVQKLRSLSLTRRNWGYFLFYFCLVNSVLEELFWRGCLWRETFGLDANDIFFGGYHALVLAFFAAPVWLIPVFCACVFAGWLWRTLLRITGSLALPMVMHVVADVSIAVAVYLRLQF